MKEIIEEIVVVLLQKAFPLTLRYKTAMSSSDTFKSLGLFWLDVGFFIEDFIEKEGVPFYLYHRHEFIGDSIGDMVDFIDNSFSAKVHFSLLLSDIKTRKRNGLGMAL